MSFSMRMRLLVTLALLILLALAFAAGIIVQREFLATIGVAQISVPQSPAPVDVSPAPQFEELVYPNAESKGGNKGNRPSWLYEVLVTPDRFEDVVRFYAAKAGFDEPDQAVRERWLSSYKLIGGNEQSKSYLLTDDLDESAGAQASRPVQAKCLIRRYPSYDLTIFITRGTDETHTHIILVYDQKGQ